MRRQSVFPVAMVFGNVRTCRGLPCIPDEGVLPGACAIGHSGRSPPSSVWGCPLTRCGCWSLWEVSSPSSASLGTV
jgi:hypothetical protein